MSGRSYKRLVSTRHRARRSAGGEGDVPFGVRNGGTVGNVPDRAGVAASHENRLGSAFAGDEKVPRSYARLDQLARR